MMHVLHNKSVACKPSNITIRRRALRVQCVVAPETPVVTTNVKRNPNIAKLQAGYLFPEIARRRREHQEKNPEAKIISLGIGDTTEPIPAVISDAMRDAAIGLGTRAGYSGYGAEQGRGDLREALQSAFYSNVGIKANEIFVSDGSKCDIGRLQMMFGADVSVAVQDPSYPVYVDSSVIMGMTGSYEEAGYGNIQYMVCTPDNDFFPDLSKVPRTDLIFFCSPNNPTGASATRAQLKQLVDFARANGSIIVYDAAYALFIKDDDCPRTIYEIEGAKECAIETCSFSKYAGFTGVRAGWTVVPEALKYADGSPVINDFNRIMTTVFNGASNIAQAGALACLTPEGLKAMNELVDFYMENAAILRKTFTDMGFTVYGGTNAPYVWVGFPGRKSWDVFAEILEKCNIVTTPGSGFGPAGEGFVRASSFGTRENVLEAVERFQKAFAGCCGPASNECAPTSANGDHTYEITKEYYGKVLNTSKDLKTSACTAAGRPSGVVADIMAKIPDEVVAKFYGCGAPLPLGIDGLTVLDLGSGSGRDCYVCSALVGAQGRVIGIDMTEEQLAVARTHQDEFAQRIGHTRSNMEFVQGTIEHLDRAGIADNSVDIIISNCVINLSPDKPRVLQEAYRVLRPGGELYFSDVYSDRRVSEEAKKDKLLWGECISGALYVGDFKRIAADAGFLDVRMLNSSPITVPEEFRKLLGATKFYSITYRLFKLPGLMETACEDYGQVLRYKGTFPGSETRFVLDNEHVFEPGKPYLVCGNTAAMCGENNVSWLSRHFDISGNRDVHYGLFASCGVAAESESAAPAGGCC